MCRARAADSRVRMVGMEGVVTGPIEPGAVGTKQAHLWTFALRRWSSVVRVEKSHCLHQPEKISTTCKRLEDSRLESAAKERQAITAWSSHSGEQQRRDSAEPAPRIAQKTRRCLALLPTETCAQRRPPLSISSGQLRISLLISSDQLWRETSSCVAAS